MSRSTGTPSGGLGKPIGLSLLGAVIVAPVPLLSGRPDLLPAWLLQTTAGVPNLSWALVAMMAALIGVAILASGSVDGADS